MTRVEDMCWRWELTPMELLAGFQPIRSKRTENLTSEVKPFKNTERKPLPGTDLLYQFAVSDCAVTQDITRIREAQPDLPVSGDRRSGVLVYDQNKLVGSCVIQGNMYLQGYKMSVHPDYRRQGIAYRMLLEWCRETKRARELPKQGITLNSAKALLRVHKELIGWALQEGKEVPDRVVQAVEDGQEAERILARLQHVDALTSFPRKRSEVTWQL
jgi:GNAT superfamily N-acetyltransferase